MKIKQSSEFGDKWTKNVEKRKREREREESRVLSWAGTAGTGTAAGREAPPAS